MTKAHKISTQKQKILCLMKPPLTVVMLSRDNVSGVSDDEILLRCAVFLIFLLAACTIFATKRDELSLWESLELIAAENDRKVNNSTLNHSILAYAQFWQHSPKGNQLKEAPSQSHWKFESSCSSVLAKDRFRRNIRTVKLWCDYNSEVWWKRWN